MISFIIYTFALVLIKHATTSTDQKRFNIQIKDNAYWITDASSLEACDLSEHIPHIKMNLDSWYNIQLDINDNGILLMNSDVFDDPSLLSECKYPVLKILPDPEPEIDYSNNLIKLYVSTDVSPMEYIVSDRRRLGSIDWGSIEDVVINMGKEIKKSLESFGPVDLNRTYTEPVVDTDCTVIFPDQSTSTSNTYGIAKAYAWGVVDLLGFAGPAGTVAAAGLHFIEAMGMTNEEDSEADEYNKRIQYAFEQSWACTKKYVESEIAVGRLAELTDDQHQTEKMITEYVSRINALDSTNPTLFEGNIIDSIQILGSPLTFASPFGSTNEFTPGRCRVHMDELTTVISQIELCYELYVEAVEASGNNVDIVTKTSIKESILYLLKVFKVCAPYALYDVLKNSKSLSLDDIAQQLDIIYSGDLFCSWVDFAFDMIFHSYQFGPNTDELNNFEEWKLDSCSSDKWISYVNEETLSISAADEYIIDGYAMSVSDLWPDLSRENDIIYAVYFYKTFYHDDNDRDSTETRNNCFESWDSSTDHTEYLWKRATVINARRDGEGNIGARFIMNGCASEGTNCYPNSGYLSDITSVDTITHTCPQGTFITAGRYLVYDPLSTSTDGLGIGGLQLSCSNPNHYTQITDEYYNVDYDTAFKQLNSNYLGEYEWSPWYVCPVGYYLDIKLMAMNGCEYNNEYWGRIDSGFWNPQYREQYLTTITDKQKVVFRCVKSENGIYDPTLVKKDYGNNKLIESYHGVCLSVIDGIDIELVECDDSVEAQKFYFTDDNEIKNINGKCLQVDEESDDSLNVELQIMECDESSNQQWSLDVKDYNAGGTQRIHFSNGRCLSHKYGITNNIPTVSICEMEINDDNEWVTDPINRWNIVDIGE